MKMTMKSHSSESVENKNQSIACFTCQGCYILDLNHGQKIEIYGLAPFLVFHSQQMNLSTRMCFLPEAEHVRLGEFLIYGVGLG